MAGKDLDELDRDKAPAGSDAVGAVDLPCFRRFSGGNAMSNAGKTHEEGWCERIASGILFLLSLGLKAGRCPFGACGCQDQLLMDKEQMRRSLAHEKLGAQAMTTKTVETGLFSAPLDSLEALPRCETGGKET